MRWMHRCIEDRWIDGYIIGRYEIDTGTLRPKHYQQIYDQMMLVELFWPKTMGGV